MDDDNTRSVRRGTPEHRFMERMAFCGPDVPTAHEVVMPRKSRSLDLVMKFAHAPVWFGALRDVLSERVVLFEHVSRRARRHDVASARVGEAWLAWERLRPRGRRREPYSPWIGTDIAVRAPVAVVVADGIPASLRGAVPLLRPWSDAGVWATCGLDEGGVVVLDTTRVRAEEGYAWWSWLGRARTDAEAAERLFRLLGDASIPTVERERLKEAIVDGELETSVTEREGLYQKWQREIRESREEGLKEGVQRGHRDALLRLAASLAPEALAELRAIDHLEDLEKAVTAHLLRRR